MYARTDLITFSINFVVNPLHLVIIYLINLSGVNVHTALTPEPKTRILLHKTNPYLPRFHLH